MVDTWPLASRAQKHLHLDWIGGAQATGRGSSHKSAIEQVVVELLHQLRLSLEFARAHTHALPRAKSSITFSVALTFGLPEQLRQAPRCGSRTRSGKPCRSPRDRVKPLPHARGRTWLWWTEGIAQRELQARPLHRRSDCLSQVVEAAPKSPLKTRSRTFPERSTPTSD